MDHVLCIPIPNGYFGKRHGVHSTRHASAERIIFRISRSNRLILKQGAELIDMCEAEFIREIALAAAKVLIKRAEEHDAHEDASCGSG